MDLEKLLNKLIEKGREPRWNYRDNAEICGEYDMFIRFNHDWSTVKSFRELVSKESWLWQFCIANHLLKKYSDLWDDWEYIIGRWQDWKDCKTEDWEYIDDNRDSDIYHQDDSYQYRLIESALCDEDKLEDFLLSNIKIEW